MKIVIPTAEGKLCGHFGHCETFTFVEVDEEKKEILSIKTNAPEEGVSCQSANWIAEQGADVIMGPEARGFIFGCPTAYALNIGFVPVRKPNKLPRETVEIISP